MLSMMGQILKYFLIKNIEFSFSLIFYSTLWTPQTLHFYAFNIFCLSLLNWYINDIFIHGDITYFC